MAVLSVNVQNDNANEMAATGERGFVKFQFKTCTFHKLDFSLSCMTVLWHN